MEKIEYIQNETGFEKIVKTQVKTHEIDFEIHVLQSTIDNLLSGDAGTPEEQAAIDEVVQSLQANIAQLDQGR